VEHPEQLPPALVAERDTRADADGVARRVTDYLAGMTDRYCIRRYTELQVPQAFAR
jgi:dGTPase